jgi:hypothetical protein
MRDSMRQVDSGAAAMSLAFDVFSEKSRLKALLDHFSVIDDPRDAWRVAHPLPEVLLLVVCGTMADCDDFDGIALWGRKPSGVPAALSALSSWRSRRALA